MIASVQNNKIKELAKLDLAKYRKLQKKFIVEGPHLVSEAKKHQVLLETYTIHPNLEGELVSKEVMKKITHTDSVVSQIGVCKLIEKNKIEEKVLILDQVQDPGNLGALLRSAAAFNFKTVFLSEGCVDLYNAKVIRSSQGAIFKLNFIFGDILEFIKAISSTHQVYKTDVLDGEDISFLSFKSKVAIILGNEGNGISKEVRELPLKNIYIKMTDVESLNVSVAGSILMYELNKEKKTN